MGRLAAPKNVRGFLGRIGRSSRLPPKRWRGCVRGGSLTSSRCARTRRPASLSRTGTLRCWPRSHWRDERWNSRTQS